MANKRVLITGSSRIFRLSPYVIVSLTKDTMWLEWITSSPVTSGILNTFLN
jgi:hypothetical protein